jgi:hypothetical protein
LEISSTLACTYVVCSQSVSQEQTFAGIHHAIVDDVSCLSDLQRRCALVCQLLLQACNKAMVPKASFSPLTLSFGRQEHVAELQLS